MLLGNGHAGGVVVGAGVGGNPTNGTASTHVRGLHDATRGAGRDIPGTRPGRRVGHVTDQGAVAATRPARLTAWTDSR